MSIRLRLSPREAASIRIALKSRIAFQTARLCESYGQEYKHNEELLTHLKKLFDRFHEATYGN